MLFYCMNLNNFTIKAQEVVAASQQLAYNLKHQFIDTAHLLKSMLEISIRGAEDELKSWLSQERFAQRQVRSG